MTVTLTAAQVELIVAALTTPTCWSPRRRAEALALLAALTPPDQLQLDAAKDRDVS